MDQDASHNLHREIREEVGKLCARFPGEYWRRLDQERAYPSEFVQALTEAGYLAALIPEEYGGAGLPLSAAAAILETIHAEGCNGAACHAQMYIMGTILKHGSEEQKQTYLPKIATGELRLQAFGVTEPTSGTDTTSLRTFARREGDRYVVNGQKIWTSRVQHSDLMLLLARTTPRDEVKARTEGLSHLLVDMRDAVGHGITMRPIRTMMNHNSTEAILRQRRLCRAKNLIGEEGKGFHYILDGMNAERLLISAEMHRRRKWFTDEVGRLRQRSPRIQPSIGQNQGIQFPIARAYAQMRAAELWCTKAARKFEAGENLAARKRTWRSCWPPMPRGKRRRHACRHTADSASPSEYDVERKFRETRLYQVAPISTNLILSYVAEHVLGLPRSY